MEADRKSQEYRWIRQLPDPPTLCTLQLIPAGWLPGGIMLSGPL
jgi:hypothetical protein